MSSTLKSPVETAPSAVDEDWDFLARLAEARENLDRVARRSAPPPEDDADAALEPPVLLEDAPSIANGGDAPVDTDEPIPVEASGDAAAIAPQQERAEDQPDPIAAAAAEHEPVTLAADAAAEPLSDADEQVTGEDSGAEAERAPDEPAAEPPLETLAIHDTRLAPTQPEALADGLGVNAARVSASDHDVPAWLKQPDSAEPDPHTSDRIYAGRSKADPLAEEAQRRARETSLDELFSISQQIRDDLIEIDKAAAALRRAPTYLEAGPVVVSEVVSVRGAPAGQSWLPLAALWGVGIAVAVLGTLSIVALTQ